jgi:phosphonate transport system substrate-binding protein
MLIISSCDYGIGPSRVNVDPDEVVSERELLGSAVISDPDVYLFAFDLRLSPQEDARQYIPLLKYLAKTTGERFELSFITNYRDVAEKLGSGKIHFAAIGAGTYILATSKHKIIPLVRGVNVSGKAEYQSVIAVSPESPVKEIADLRNKYFAFGSFYSTQGHLIPRIVLAEHGLTLDEFESYCYAGSHFNCANKVISGASDACGMQDTMGREFERMGMVRIINTSRFFPSSGISASSHVPPEVIEKVKNALLDFQPLERDAEGLYKWDQTEMPNGFILAKDEDYADLREQALQLGIIKRTLIE